MNVKCEIDTCTDNAQPQSTASGDHLCAVHYEQLAANDLSVVVESGKVVLKKA
jgi:hypothetical protein